MISLLFCSIFVAFVICIRLSWPLPLFHVVSSNKPLTRHITCRCRGYYVGGGTRSSLLLSSASDCHGRYQRPMSSKPLTRNILCRYHGYCGRRKSVLYSIQKDDGKQDEVGLRILNGRPLVDGRVTELGFGLLQQHNDEMSQSNNIHLRNTQV
mmetsp:Transcript_2518/g.4539  ORF Transcript_2518/g.4539 Transcript_2518/m.4539 type:complete len:153 (+) Transcript_2518:727-1185(+)